MNDINKQKRIAILDCRADNSTVYALEEAGLRVIPTMKLDCVYDAIATHTDIQIHYLGENRFLSAPETYEHYKKYLKDFIVVKGSAELCGEYPGDIAYNAAVIKDFVICSEAHTAPEIIENYKMLKILNVKQGYCRCNICIVSGNAIITSDAGIAAAAEKNNIDVLRIEQGHIKLRSFDYGFIGGASGLTDENLLSFNGELSTHPQGEEIKKFCNRHGVEIIELKKGVMEDVGSIITTVTFR